MMLAKKLLIKRVAEMLSNLLGIFFFISLFLPFNILQSQHKFTAGGYAQRIFSSRTYGGHPRNFAIDQNSNGFIFVGNAFGLLQFDGQQWQKYSLPQGNSAYAVFCDSDGKIWTGSYQEAGYFSPQVNGTLQYTSITSQLPAEFAKAGEVLDIVTYNQGVLLLTRNTLFYLTSGICKMYPTSSRYIAMKKYNHQIFLLSEDALQQWTAEGVHTLQSFNRVEHPLAFSIQHKKIYILEETNIRTYNLGSKETQSFFLPAGMAGQYKGIRCLADSTLLLFSYAEGILLLNPSGIPQQRIARVNGLMGNTIHDVCTDARGDLWLALDNGIAFLEYSSPFRYMNASNGVEGMGYSSALHRGDLYLGTSMGLYLASLNDLSCLPVSSVRGQIWHLQTLKDKLLICQPDKCLEFDQGKLRDISGPLPGEGNWTILPLKKHPDLFIKGTYEGLQLYRYRNGQWNFACKIKGFQESSRIIEEDPEGNLWVCHGNKGVFYLRMSEDYSTVIQQVSVNEKNHLPPDYFYDISSSKGKLLLSGQSYYWVDLPEARLRNDTLFVRLSGSPFSDNLKEDAFGHTWLFFNSDLFLIHQKQSGYWMEEISFKKIAQDFIGSYQHVLPLSRESAILSTQDGFVYFNYQNKNQASVPFRSFITSLRAASIDSIVYTSYLPDSQRIVLPYEIQPKRVSFGSNFFESPDDLWYQYAIRRSSAEELTWSTWTRNHEIDFSQWREGRYELLVRAKNCYKEISKPATLSFIILPPWYRSTWAYTVYMLVGIGFLYFLYWWVVRRFKEQKQRLEDENARALQLREQSHINEKLQQEKELMKLRNEKLEAEMILKNNELANYATNLTQKAEFLASVKDKLETIQKENTAESLRELVKSIDQDLDFDDDWSRFQIHFDQIYPNYLHTLRQRHPRLKPSWLLLCAYIRMNKSNKEIASLLNLSLAGIEKRKYRLKEKLELTEDQKLSDYLLSIGSSHF